MRTLLITAFLLISGSAFAQTYTYTNNSVTHQSNFQDNDVCLDIMGVEYCF